MNEQEALKLGKALYDNITSNSNNIITTKDYVEYVAKANETLEKQVAKKPVLSKYKNFECPCCGDKVTLEMDHGWEDDYRFDYCDNCGQKIDWSDEE